MSVNTEEVTEVTDRASEETTPETPETADDSADAEAGGESADDKAGGESADAEAGGESASEETETAEGPGAAEASETGGETPPNAAAEGPDESKGVQRAEFQALSEGRSGPAGDNMYLLLDVTVPVTCELGGTTMSLREILGLGPGSVVRLDRPLGEPVDILVNGERVGKGEVVVVDDQFGVRVTELVEPGGSEKA